MRFLTATIFAATFATSAAALDLPVPGLALNTDAKVEYKMDAETTAATLAPELSYTPSFVGGLNFTSGTTLNVWDNDGGFTLGDQFDTLPTLDFGATYAPAMMDNLELEVGTSYDLEAKERGEVTVSATFSF